MIGQSIVSAVHAKHHDQDEGRNGCRRHAVGNTLNSVPAVICKQHESRYQAAQGKVYLAHDRPQLCLTHACQ